MKTFSFKAILPHFIAVALIVFLSVLYFSPQLSGKVLPMGDITQFNKMAKEISDYNSSHDEPTLWTNSMFGGMPTFQLAMPTKANMLEILDKIFSLGFERPIGYFIFGMLFFYISMILLGANAYLALFGALMFGFTTNNIVLFEAGHMTKIKVLMTGAPMICGLIMVYKEKILQGALLFSVALGLNLMYNHVQMTYYMVLIIVPLVIFFIVKSILDKRFAFLGKAVIAITIGSILAVGASASRLWTTYEYSKETLRGDTILTKADSSSAASQTTGSGLGYEYAMQWSNGLGDVLAGIYPQIVGGSSSEQAAKGGEFAKAFGQGREISVPSYHGSLPFTSGPVYYGIVVFLLALVGLFALKGELKWWLIFVILFTILLSFGKNFNLLNETLFNHFPLFNKFRSPSSVLSITTFLIPLLAVLGINSLYQAEDKSQYLKPLKIIAGVFVGVSLILWLFGSSFFSFSTEADTQYNAQVLNLIMDERKSMMSSSVLRSLILGLITLGALYFYLLNKLKPVVFFLIVGFLGVADLWTVDKKYINTDSFRSNSQYNQNFEPRPVDIEIMKDQDLYYRVYDASINTFNSADASIFHKTIGGYHPAKLRRIQDVIERHIAKNNMRVLNMMNTKYFIVPGQNQQAMVQQNPNALGNAWLIDNIRMVKNADAESDSLSTFDPANTAIIHQEFSAYVNGFDPAKEGNIQLTAYEPNKLTYKTSTNADQLAVFSEMWYGPNKGWQAYLDGKPVDHIRANYLLRAMKIPAGEHEVVFEFKPKSFETGELLSRWSSILLITMIAGVILWNFIPKKSSLD